MAPVGQASWQGALAQCLHTSLCMSQRSVLKKGRAVPGGVSGISGRPRCPIFSINCTCRQGMALSCPVFSWVGRVRGGSLAGNWFHCLRATSQALQPIQRLVSVKKPIAGCVGNGGRFCNGDMTLTSCCITVWPICFCICRSLIIIALYSFNAPSPYVASE